MNASRAPESESSRVVVISKEFVEAAWSTPTRERLLQSVTSLTDLTGYICTWKYFAAFVLNNNELYPTPGGHQEVQNLAGPQKTVDIRSKV